MEKSIKIWKILCEGFSHPEKEEYAKWAKLLECVNEENIKLLKDNDIEIRHARMINVLALKPEVLENRIKFYLTNPDLLNAIKESPFRLMVSKEVVNQRMSICDRIEYPYKDDEGRFSDVIFDEQKFNDEVWLKLTNEQKKIFEGYVKEKNDEKKVKEEKPKEEQKKEAVQKKIIENNNSQEANDNFLNDDIKEIALRVLEQFALTDQKDIIFNRLDELKDSELSKKEKLLEAMKVLGSNTELLVATIDEVLESYEKDKKELRR